MIKVALKGVAVDLRISGQVADPQVKGKIFQWKSVLQDLLRMIPAKTLDDILPGSLVSGLEAEVGHGERLGSGREVAILDAVVAEWKSVIVKYTFLCRFHQSAGSRSSSSSRSNPYFLRNRLAYLAKTTPWII
jgi:hypothetical protein